MPYKMGKNHHPPFQAAEDGMSETLPVSPDEESENSLHSVRVQLLKAIVYVFAGLGLPALAGGLMETLHFGQWLPAAVYTALYIPVLAAAVFWRRLPFRLTAWLLIAAVYALALFILLNVGLHGAGIHLLLALCVLSTVLLGIRAGIWIIGLGTVAIVAAGAGFTSGVLSLQPGFLANATSGFSWAAAAMVFILLAGALVFIPGVLQKRLRDSLAAATQSRKKLQTANQALQKQIQERQKTEQSLRESQERLRVLFQYAPDGYYINDTNGVFLDANRMAEVLSGYSREELVGKDYFSAGILSPPDLEKTLGLLEKNRQGESTGPVEFTLTRKDGSRVDVEIRTYPVTLAGEMAVLGIARDVTERKEAEEERIRLEAQLHHAQRMEAIGTLAGGIAHDFNNILGVIIGHADLALSELPKGSPANENLSEIRQAGLRAKDLVSQILLAARKKEQTLSVIQVAPIVKESLKLLRASLPSTVEIRQRIGDVLPPLLADPSQIQQVVINLCTNAAQAMEKSGGSLEVSMEAVFFEAPRSTPLFDLQEGLYLCLTVADTGPGIPDEIRDRIFEPYFTTKGVGKGSGLGLAVVQGIVHARGGGITVESRPEAGATFRVFLPAAKEAAVELPEEPEDQTSILKGSERILFVDDEPAIMELGIRLLTRLGYAVEARASGTDALACFSRNPYRFDLVITDMTMPHMTGEDLARHILAIRPDIPIILCTGYSSRMAAEKANEIGIRKFVEKPLTANALARSVRHVLDQ